MIAYSDTAPKVAPHNGDFLVTFASGGDEIKLLLTRHALFGLAASTSAAAREVSGSIQPLPFPARCEPSVN